MYSNADATRVVETQSNGEKYDVDQGSTRLPKIADVPYLDVVAALNSSGKKLTLFCVNRHLTRDLKTNLVINGFHPTRASAHTISAESIYEKNDETEPEHILPRDSSIPISLPSEIAYTFRHENITVIELSD